MTDTVLRSGTDDVRGSPFAYKRIQKLAANDFFSNTADVKDETYDLKDSGRRLLKVGALILSDQRPP